MFLTHCLIGHPIKVKAVISDRTGVKNDGGGGGNTNTQILCFPSPDLSPCVAKLNSLFFFYVPRFL